MLNFLFLLRKYLLTFSFYGNVENDLISKDNKF